ncbi:MAG: hypothetical protein EPN62_20025 [Candidimonas sp.]|nr:MAG: hypothetical protein EPN77_19285 [Candidimonas sp.]TAM17235.1 MAG: hypothetical protein EPN62_20025 [Candidimonas sp.]
MISYVHAAYPAQQYDVAPIESAAKAARQPRGSMGNRKGLAALLLSAVVAALLVAANQLIDTWSDNHLLAAWIVMWAIGLAALGLLAGTARELAAGLATGFNTWSQRVARAHADAHFIETARHDPRIMAELQAASAYQYGDETHEAPLESAIAVSAPWPAGGLIAQYESSARGNIRVAHFAF